MGEADKGFVFSAFKNFYFEISKENPIAIAPLIFFTDMFNKLIQELVLTFEKIKYLDIIDFDNFYSSSKDLLIIKFINIVYQSTDPKMTNNAMYSFT
jgi:hypothetical protein